MALTVIPTPGVHPHCGEMGTNRWYSSVAQIPALLYRR